MSEYSRDSIVVTGLGYEVPAVIRRWFTEGAPAGQNFDEPLSHDADPLPFLRVRKTLKFMSKQDRLAMSAAAQAVQSAGLSADLLDQQTMIAMCVGPIPFREDEAIQVAANSSRDGEFSNEEFCRNAYESVNPMLLFACLPNMPAYHISANLGIRGGYCLTYPSSIDSCVAFQRGVDALAAGRVRAVLYGGVTDQQNFLVRNHHRKTGQVLPAPDCACFILLEKLGDAQARKAPVRCYLQSEQLLQDSTAAFASRSCYFGPAELPREVAMFAENTLPLLKYRLSENGYTFESKWKK